MSEDEMCIDNTDTQLLTAEYNDGHLQIVEVTPFEKDKGNQILPDLLSSDDGQMVEVELEGTTMEDGMVQLGLLNLTLVKCGDGENSYRLVSHSEADGSDPTDLSDATVTCVLQSSDGEDADNQESYVMVDGDDGPLLYLQPSVRTDAQPEQPHSTARPEQKSKSTPSPLALLERTKSLKKAKQLLSRLSPARAGRRRGADRAALRDMLAAPGFKLFLYSCTMCSFKCNAIKELTAHKATEHVGSAGKYRPSFSVQCAKCPFRGSTHTQLMKHIGEKHPPSFEVVFPSLDSKEVEEADILVCGACGFEAGDADTFREHIVDKHPNTSS